MEDWNRDLGQLERLWQTYKAAGLDRRQFLKVMAGLAGSAAVGTVLGGCAPATPAPGPAATVAPVATAVPKPAAITVGLPLNIGTLDARRTRIREEVQLYVELYDGLVEFDPNGNIVPVLAESLVMVDPLTWRATLRTGVKFHNGEDFNADAVKFSIDQYTSLDPTYYYLQYWGTGWKPTVTVESPTSVLIKTPKPLPVMPRLLPRIGMLPPKASLDPAFGDHPVGTGPYTFVSWTKGENVVLKANPNYFRGAPKIPQITFRIITDSTALAAALEAGEIDVASQLTPDRAIPLASKVNMLESAGLSIGMWNYNMKNTSLPISDVKYRQALQYAIDKQGIIKNILSGKAMEMHSVVPDTAEGVANVGSYPAYDVATAKKMLADAGYGKGTSLNLIFTPETSNGLEVAEALQQNLAQVGVTVSIIILDSGTYLTRRGTADWDLASSGVTGWTGDCDFFIGSVTQQTGYNSAPVNAARAAANEAPDPKARLTAMADVQKMIWADAPYLWTYGTVMFNGMAKRLSGVQMTRAGWFYFRQATVSA
jgi:peptide/nickel transport system substrate-binding protein